MSGIAGIVYPDIFQMNDLIRPMMQMQRHRCNKVIEDIHTYQNIQIAVCGGKFSNNQQGTIIAGIDGFISNIQNLSKKLDNLGYAIEGKEPSELIVYAYTEWGRNLFDHIKGQFAIVILDQNKKELLLSRDRIGKKPIYWYQNAHFFIFASELKSILATGCVPQTPALDSLASYFYFGFIPQDMSPIAGINKLLPAHYLQFYQDKSKAINSYWSYSSFFEKEERLSTATVTRELEKQLKANLSENLSQTETIGFFLSGDLGSATLTSYATQLIPKSHMIAYTVNFLGEDDDDLMAAKTVASTLGISHEIFTLTEKNFLDDLLNIIWHLDEPLANPNIIGTWKLAKLAEENCKTVVSGIGSEELFAGHSRYSLREQEDSPLMKIGQFFSKGMEKALVPLFSLLYKPFAFELLKHSKRNLLQRNYLKQIALTKEKEIYEMSPHLGGLFDAEVFFHKFYNLSRLSSPVASYLYFDIKTRLPDDHLIQLDKITAAHALNWQVPFLDKDIEEFLAKLPEPKYLKENETNFYLKIMLRNIFPDAVVYRSKRTRKSFLKNWLVRDEMKALFKLLMNGTLVETGILSRDWLLAKIARIEAEPLSFKHLWAMLILEIWFRLFVNHPLTPPPSGLTVKQFIEEPL